MKSIYYLWKIGALDDAIKLGILKSKVVPYCKIYDVYIQQREIGLNYTQAVANTAETLGVAEITVKKAITQVI